MAKIKKVDHKAIAKDNLEAVLVEALQAAGFEIETNIQGMYTGAKKNTVMVNIKGDGSTESPEMLSVRIDLTTPRAGSYVYSPLED